LKNVYRFNWNPAVAIAITFTIQYSFYPGVILKYEPSFFTSFSWFVICVVTYHSFWDTIGRYLGGKISLINKEQFMAASLSRIIFVVFYLLTFKSIQPQIFGSNWFIIANLTLFSVSCGYLSTIGMNFGADETTVNQSLAGSIMGFHLTLGICLGSAIALIFLSN